MHAPLPCILRPTCNVGVVVQSIRQEIQVGYGHEGEAPLKEGERRAVSQPRKHVLHSRDDNGKSVAAMQVDLAQLNMLKKPNTGRLCRDLNKYVFHHIRTLKHSSTGSLASFVAKFVDWQPTTTHKEVSMSKMTASPSYTLTTALGLLLQTPNYSKLMRVSGKCQQTTTKKNLHHIQEIQGVLLYGLCQRVPT
jgi:hypothetical protein